MSDFTKTVRSIVLVEDDSNYALLVQLGFDSAAVTNPIRVVGDGESAIAYLSSFAPYDGRTRSSAPALVILDIRLPARSGLDVLRWIRSQREFERLPVVILAASTNPGEQVRALQLGATLYMQKPKRIGEFEMMAGAFARLWLDGSPRRRRAAGGRDSG